LAFLTELRATATWSPKLRVVASITGPVWPPGWSGRRGRFTTTSLYEDVSILSNISRGIPTNVCGTERVRGKKRPTDSQRERGGREGGREAQEQRERERERERQRNRGGGRDTEAARGMRRLLFISISSPRAMLRGDRSRKDIPPGFDMRRPMC
jgi:hypothetical protein